MNGQVTPHRQAPIDLRDVIERAATQITDLIPYVTDVVDGTRITIARDLAAELRALLPHPLFTCPNCEHPDDQHFAHGCGRIVGVTGDRCSCEITPAALPQVRALLAAERDSKGTPAKPRVWSVGDPEPEDVTEVQDSDSKALLRNWRRGEDGRWRLVDKSGDTFNRDAGRTWMSLLEEYGDFGPLTEVLPGGVR